MENVRVGRASVFGLALFSLGLGLGLGLGLAGCDEGSVLPDQLGSPPVDQAGPSPVERTPREACTAIAGQMIGGAIINSATFLSGTAQVGEYCEVTGTLRTSLRFRVTLPTAWNSKLLYIGGGGWDGTVTTSGFSPTSISNGYVVVGSNGGHDDPSGAVFLNNPDVQRDFGYLSIHTVLGVVKQIVRQRYGQDAKRHYFEGCSNGGREALIQASRYPQDFDGIVARAPAYSFTELCLAFLNNMKHMLGTAGGAISAAKTLTIAKAAVTKCDALDGLADTVISNVEACQFDPATLRCPAADNDSCLTNEQINTAKTIYSEYKLANGTSVYPGWGFGGEEQGWAGWLLGSPPSPPAQMFFADALIRYWLVKNPGFNPLTFDPLSYQPQIAEAAQILDASADLSAFFARNGKLILAHGDSDWAISYKGSINYFSNVGKAVGTAKRDAAMEFFLQPGVQHCVGGTGPDTIDLLNALSSWVEEGQRPSTANLVLTKQDATGKVTFSRPLCRYPGYPHYKGTGDVLAAASYTCKTP